MFGPILALLSPLFLLRILGQFLVAFVSVGWLPPMEQWFSGLIPYSILLAIQIVMFGGMIKISADIWYGRGYFAVARPSWSRMLIGLGAL